MDAAPATQRLTVREKIGYGFGDLASNLFWQMFSIFIAKYYTDVFLLGAAAMGTMLLVTRIGDAFVDPIVGALADRTRTRWGHFRPYLLWMALPMAGTAIAAFTVPDLQGNAKLVYAYVTLSLMMVAYSAINIPYSALLGVLTPDSRDRTSASTYRFVMAFLPVFLIVNTALPMAKYFGGSETSARGWQVTMALYAAVAVVLYVATFLMTKERVQPPPEQKTRLADDVRDLFSNRPWVVLSVVGIAALTYANIRSTVTIYYFENVVPGGASWFGPVMTTGAVAFIVGVMAASPLAKRFGKRNFYMASMALTALLTIAFYWVPPDNLQAVWGMHALISLVSAPTAPLVWAMYADTADYCEWKNHRRATGLVFSAASFSQKFGWAIGGAGAGWLLAWFGYQPNTTQNADTLHGIVLMMSLIPTAGALLALAALWFYPLDEATVERMGHDLAARRAAAPEAGPDGGGAAEGASGGAQAAAVSPRDVAAATLAGLAVAEAPRLQAAAAVAGDRPDAGVVDPLPVPMLAEAGSGSAPRAGSGGAPPRVRTPVTGAPAPLALPLASADPQALADEFRAIFRARLHGLCFSPYVGAQGPGSAVTPAQIRERLAIVAPHTRWVRTFSCTEGHEHTPAIAHELGLKTLVGCWIGQDEDRNREEIEGLIAVARAGHADLVAVGNEVLLREDLSEDALLAHIARVKHALPGVPVGYVDAWYLFEEHPRLAAACDVIHANCYPFWEGCRREQAVPYMHAMLQRVRAAAPGRRIVVSETGWPDQGGGFQGALASMEGAQRYFVDTHRWAVSEGIELFWFSTFDEAWKGEAEGGVGTHWGLWDAAGAPKFPGMR